MRTEFIVHFFSGDCGCPECAFLMTFDDEGEARRAASKRVFTPGGIQTDHATVYTHGWEKKLFDTRETDKDETTPHVPV